MRLAFFLSTLLCVYAVDTKTWQQGSLEDFDQGTLQHLSLSSDGKLSVAPRVREMYDSSLAVLWAVARDSKGVIYTCLLYTSDAADERSSVDLGGRRIIKKKKK